MFLRLGLRGKSRTVRYIRRICNINIKMGFFTPLKDLNLVGWVMFLAIIVLFVFLIISIIKSF